MNEVTSPKAEWLGEHTHRLLIVDDNPAIHEDVKKVLRPSDAGAEIEALELELFGGESRRGKRIPLEFESAYNGQEAVEVARSKIESGLRFSIALVDIRMPPGWDGIRTVEELWQVDPNVCVVICSAYSDYTRDEIVGRLGQDDKLYILKKPFDPEELQQLILAICRNREAQAAMRSVQDRQSAIWFDDNPGMVFRLSPDGIVRSVSRFAEKRLRLAAGEAVGRPFSDWLEGRSRSGFEDLLLDLQQGVGRPSEAKLTLQSGGDPVVLNVLGQYIGIGTDEPSIWLSATEATGTQDLAQRLLMLERTDVSTDLPNRRGLLESLAAAHRAGGSGPLVLAVLRIDQSEQILGNNGRAAHNAVRRQLGRLLAEEFRDANPVAAIDDSSFAAVLARCTVDQLVDRSAAFCSLVRERVFNHEGVAIPVCVSIGIAPCSGQDAERPIRLAEAACAEAQRLGGNRVQECASDDLDIKRREQISVQASCIVEAIKQDRLLLHAQPIVSLESTDYAPFMAELLIRIRDEQDEIVPPDQFLPVAAQYHLCEQIDRWVLQTALAHLRADASAMVAINLSGASLGSQEFLSFARAAVGVAPDVASRLHFEITESAAITHLQTAKLFICEMKQLGVQFSLDDFGTGLCSFSYLRDLDVDVVKIDGSFVRDIVTDGRALATVKAINEVAKAHGKMTVAEFVEDEDTARILQDIGVDYGQGHLFGRPMPIPAPEACAGLAADAKLG